MIPESEGGAQNNPKETAENIRKQIVKDLSDLMRRNPSVLVKYRNKKIKNMGNFKEV